MLERRIFRRMTLYVVGSSVLLSAAAFALGGVVTGFGAIVGGAVGVANWLLVLWVGKRLLVASDKGRLVWGTLLALKMFALLGVTWLILSTGRVDPIGFTVGLSGLVLGALAGAFHSALEGGSASHGASEEQS
jgi:hypothetical protein